MKCIIISKFKARCTAIIDEVSRSGEPVIITRRGKPTVRIEPVDRDRADRQLGALRDSAVIRGDIVEFDSSGDWESLS